MGFERNTSTGTFVAWGKEKAKEESFIIEQGKHLEGVVRNIKDSLKFVKIFEVETKVGKETKTIIVPGTTILCREMGYEYKTNDRNEKIVLPADEQSAEYRVQNGDRIRIHFEGMLPAKAGKNEAYNLWVEVDK